MTWTHIALSLLSGALPLFLGVLLGSFLFNQRQKMGLQPLIRKWEYTLSSLLGDLPQEQWPARLSRMRSEMRDVVGLPTYDGKPSEPSQRH